MKLDSPIGLIKINLSLSSTLMLAVFAGLTACSADILPVPAAKQENSNWCWAACSQMVLGYYGVNISQNEIATFGVGINPLTRSPFNKGDDLNGDQPVQGSNGEPPTRSVSMILDHYSKLVTRPQRGPTAKDLIDAIDSKSPAILLYNYYHTNTSTGLAERLDAHMVVLYGYSGDSFYVHNPTRVEATTFPAGDTGLRFEDLSRGRFTTKGLGGTTYDYSLYAALFIQNADLVLLLDSTGSMEPELDSIKAQALNIVNQFKIRYSKPRVAVADYKDDPDYGGDSGDYIYKVDSTFTDDANAVSAALTPITADGGGDTAEGLFSALSSLIDGTTIGGFRKGNVDRNIYVFTDAVGKSPEPWPSGTTLEAVIAKAKLNGVKISTFPCVVNSSGGTSSAMHKSQYARYNKIRLSVEDADESSLLSQMESLSNATGGTSKTLHINNGILDGGELLKSVDKSISYSRTPKGQTTEKRPVFTFREQGYDMTTYPTGVYMQLQKYDAVLGSWYDYPNGLSFSSAYGYWIPGFNLKKGDYRWRLCHTPTQPLPLLQTDDSAVQASNDLVCEAKWTKFSRVKAKK